MEYWSKSKGFWLTTEVMHCNSDGSFDLTVKNRADAKSIRNAAAFAVGENVLCCLDLKGDRWLPGIVVTQNLYGTYDVNAGDERRQQVKLEFIRRTIPEGHDAGPKAPSVGQSHICGKRKREEQEDGNQPSPGPIPSARLKTHREKLPAAKDETSNVSGASGNQQGGSSASQHANNCRLVERSEQAPRYWNQACASEQQSHSSSSVNNPGSSLQKEGWQADGRWGQDSRASGRQRLDSSSRQSADTTWQFRQSWSAGEHWGKAKSSYWQPSSSWQSGDSKQPPWRRQGEFRQGEFQGRAFW